MVKKLENATMINNIMDLVEDQTHNWPDVPENINISYRLAYQALAEASKDFNNEAYVAFGYMMARAEVEERLLRYALRGRAAEARQAKASDGRHGKAYAKTEPLRAAARRIIAEDANVSLGACSRRVSEEMANDPTWKMSSDPKWIAGRIRELFERRGIKNEYQPIKSR